MQHLPLDEYYVRRIKRRYYLTKYATFTTRAPNVIFSMWIISLPTYFCHCVDILYSYSLRLGTSKWLLSAVPLSTKYVTKKTKHFYNTLWPAATTNTSPRVEFNLRGDLRHALELQGKIS